MKRLLLVAGLLASPAFAQEESEIGASVGGDTSFRYGYAFEDSEAEDGTDVKERWISVSSGHLSAAIDSKMEKHRVVVNANAAELFGLQATAANETLKRFQFEAASGNDRATYGLVAVEAPFVKAVNVYVGSVHNPGGNQRFVVGPVASWSKSKSTLLFFPKASDSDSVIDHTLVLRNRIREIDYAWFDIDASYKMVDEDDEVDDWSPYGYSAAVGVWKVYAKWALTPYYAGTIVRQTKIEFGVNAQF